MCLRQASRRNLSHCPASSCHRYYYHRCNSTGLWRQSCHPLNGGHLGDLRVHLNEQSFFFAQQEEDDGATAALAWKETDLDVMDARLKAAISLAPLQGQAQCPPALEPSPGVRGTSSSSREAVPLGDGWRLLTEADGWRPCPIGIYIGGR